MNYEENNCLKLQGKILKPFVYQTQYDGERFFMTEIMVKRLSNQYDCIKILVSEKIVNVDIDYKERWVNITGQFHSYNSRCENKSHLLLFGFIKEWNFLNTAYEWDYINKISICGFLCKPPIYRKTPMGREITDILLAVNREYGKTDYIPCILWGRNARYASGLKVGNQIEAYGRIQSREYNKKILEKMEVVRKIAYEVSVSKVNLCRKK